MKSKVTIESLYHYLNQESPACGPRGPFLRPAVRFGNFQIINIYVAKCLEKGCCEIVESKLNDTRCSFRPCRSTIDHISLSSNILRNLGNILKKPSHALSTWRKHTTGFLVKSFGECCVSTVLTTAWYRATNHCIPCSEVCVRVGRLGELNHDRSPLVLDSTGVCCHRSVS